MPILMLFDFSQQSEQIKKTEKMTALESIFHPKTLPNEFNINQKGTKFQRCQSPTDHRLQ